MRVDASDLIELAKANGFESVTEAITIAKKSRAEIERLQHHIACAEDAMQKMMGVAKQADAEIERLRAARDEMLVALKAVYAGEPFVGSVEITLPEKLHRLVVDAIANAARHKGEA
jgi:hypothetical protein